MLEFVVFLNDPLVAQEIAHHIKVVGAAAVAAIAVAVLAWRWLLRLPGV